MTSYHNDADSVTYDVHSCVLIHKAIGVVLSLSCTSNLPVTIDRHILLSDQWNETIIEGT